MTTAQMLEYLKAEEIKTWFDLGLFLDRFRENRRIPTAEFPNFFEDFRDEVQKGGIAFTTYNYGIDGVSIEISKYANCFRSILKDVPIHYISGAFYPEGKHLIHPSCKTFTIEEIKCFDEWPLFDGFFRTKLERGSESYNRLIHCYWDEVLTITEKLGTYIEEHGIKLIYLVNVCSNPGNVSLSLAVVLISECLGIPVINNNHDFYWEGGNRRIDIETKGLEGGPRDLFFKNSDIGEFFSLLEVLFPWESRSWISANINKNQSRHIIEINGHNPANVCEIKTAVDIRAYQEPSKQAKMRSLIQISDILGMYRQEITTYTPSDVLDSGLVKEESPEPILIGARGQRSFDLVNNSVVFLQPTRIMRRKRIEVAFDLVSKLFANEGFALRFLQNPLLHLTLLVTGGIAAGQFDYFRNLVWLFSEFLSGLKKEHREKVFLGFLFSEFDKKRFIDKYDIPLSMPEIYNIASLVLLPSETEGRGLPIIEAAASGIPIFVHRYHPTAVYDEVIGKNLQESDRLRVLEFGENILDERLLDRVLEWVFFPQRFVRDIENNHRVLVKRYSMEALEKNIAEIFFGLYCQLKPNQFSMRRVAHTIDEYRETISFRNRDLRCLLNTDNRQYLPGYGRLSFMLHLKSLIDPSYFRVEEQQIRGMAMGFATELVRETPGIDGMDSEKLHRFYNGVDNMFLYQNGEIPIRHDHSFAYRHRNKNHYPYQDLTYQELTGLINLLFNKIFLPGYAPLIGEIPHLFSDANLALLQLTNSPNLAIDDREMLIDRLGENAPLVLFPSQHVKHTVDFFALQHVRRQYNIRIDEELTDECLNQRGSSVAPVYVFCSERPLGKRLAPNALESYIRTGGDPELELLLRHELLRIVKTSQWSVGIHLPQLGEHALKILRQVQQEKGCMITFDVDAAVMTDILDIDRFHIGRVQDELTARIMGIPMDSGYVQFVPAGVRTTIAYPTPIQTAKDFSRVLHGREYRKLAEEMGEKKLLGLIREDAEKRGSPIEAVLSKVREERHPTKTKEKEELVSFSYVSGLHNDKLPWNGVTARINIGASPREWHFAAISGKERKKVTEFIKDFEKMTKKKVEIAWNGGYMLNAELVGKLGLSEAYIGSPLGLIISDCRVLSPPLFNKPALIVYPDGRYDIRRVNSSCGFSVSDDMSTFVFQSEHYNLKEPKDALCFYDLLYAEESIPGNGRILVRLAGNVIKEVIHTGQGENAPVVPVGLVLSFPSDMFPPDWENRTEPLEIQMAGWGKIQNAIEAGPMLIDQGEPCIDMEIEGWKTPNSISTQAARLDFTDMRGPKIAVGLDSRGGLSVLTVNGRIRESVGATHHDMAEILVKLGTEKAMGFDPGGSSTLFACGGILNISPFNANYEKDVLSLPPEPRPVGNAVLGWLG